MFLNYFKSNRTSIIFLLPLIALLLWSNIFIDKDVDVVHLQAQMPAYALLMKWMPNVIVSKLVALFLIVVQAIYLIYINHVYQFISKKTYLISFLFVLISGAYINLHYLHPAIVANIFILLAMVELFSSYRQYHVYKFSFNTGFYIAIASLFYVNSLALLLFAFIGLTVLHTFNWREWLIVLIGFACPYLISSTILVMMDEWSVFTNVLSTIWTSSANKFVWTPAYYIFVSVLFVIALISVFNLSSTYTNNKISTRNYFSLFIVLLLIWVLVFLLIPFASIEVIVPMAVPLSYLIANYYMSKGNKWVQKISYIIFVASIFYFYIETFFLFNVSSFF